MRRGKDISTQFKNLYVIHQNIPGKKAQVSGFEQHLLFIPLQGEISIQADVTRYSFGPGQMLYLAPGVPHTFSSSSQGGERLIAMLSSRAITNSPKAIRLPLSHFIKELLFYLLLHPKTKNPGSLVSVLEETLLEILEQGSASGDVDHLEGKVTDPRVRQVLELMRNSIGRKTSMDECPWWEPPPSTM
jgi:hypothetical protein